MHIKSWARKKVQGIVGESDLKWRRPPVIDVRPSGGETRVYYLAPSGMTPSGGVRVIYRHVDMLNSMGISAAVLHDRNGFRCGWFENDTRLQQLDSLHFRANDILVVPECYGPGLQFLPDDCRKMIFNQNAHHTFDQIPLNSSTAGHPLAGVHNILSLMTVSEDNAELLEYAFPDVRVEVVRNVVDSKLFHPGLEGQHRHAIGYVPTRRAHELDQFLHIMRASGALDDGQWEFLPVTGMSELQVGEALQTCQLFVSLSEHEGFGLPAAEAMASGCYVVGFAGGGGREFFDPSYCAPVEDLTGLVRETIAALNRPQTELAELGRKASAEILGRYSLDGLRVDLERIYERVLWSG